MTQKQHTHPSPIVLWQVFISYAADRQLKTLRQDEWQTEASRLANASWSLTSESHVKASWVISWLLKEKMNSEGYFQKYFKVWEFNPVILVSPISELLWVQKLSNEGNLTSNRLLHNAEYSEQERLFQVGKHRSLGKWSHLQMFWAPSPCVQHLFPWSFHPIFNTCLWNLKNNKQFLQCSKQSLMQVKIKGSFWTHQQVNIYKYIWYTMSVSKLKT